MAPTARRATAATPPTPSPASTATPRRPRAAGGRPGHPLDATETLLAAAAGQTGGRVDTANLTDETRRVLTRILALDAPPAHAPALAAAGIDPAWTEEMGMPAIPVAGWKGHADATASLLTFAPDLTARNGYGGDLLGTVVHGSENCPARAGRDHLACARLALEAGAPIHVHELRHAADEAIAALLADWAERHPDRVVDLSPPSPRSSPAEPT